MISMFGVEVSMNMMYICWLLLFLLVIGFLRVRELIFIVGFKVLLGIVNIWILGWIYVSIVYISEGKKLFYLEYVEKKIMIELMLVLVLFR